MKKLLVLFLVLAIGFATGFASDSVSFDSSKVVVVDSIVKDTVIVTSEQSSSSAPVDPQFLLNLCAFIGLLARAVWNTYKGVKNKTNGTVGTFDFQLWLKDNVLSKLTAVMAIVISIESLVKMPDTTFWQVVMCTLAFVLGIFADWASDKLKWLTNKVKVQQVAAQVEQYANDAKAVANVLKVMGAEKVASGINTVAGKVENTVKEVSK